MILKLPFSSRLGSEAQANRCTRSLLTAGVLGLVLTGAGCAHQIASSVGNVLAEDSLAYAGDDDIELVGAAIPFGLKTIESLLQEVPEHRALLTAAARGFTQYAYVFVQLPADEMEDVDIDRAYAERERAGRLYLRARDYGLRALGVDDDTSRQVFWRDPQGVANDCREADIEALYWTAIAWSAAIAMGKDEPSLVAEIPIVDALVARVSELDPDFDAGGLHTFLISYKMARPGNGADALAAAHRHFSRAVSLSDGERAAPFVTMAESVAAPSGKRQSFEDFLSQALAIDADARIEWRLANHVMQRRARWLLTRTDTLFLE